MDWFPITPAEALEVAIALAAFLSVVVVGWYFWRQD
jgi:hypothetical protein